MLTGQLAVRNLLLGQQNDLWSVNTEQEYHEQLSEEAEAAAPEELARILEAELSKVFVKLEPRRLGLSVGAAVGSRSSWRRSSSCWAAVLTPFGLLGQYFRLRGDRARHPRGARLRLRRASWGAGASPS